MKDIIDHLGECGVGVFQANEINEPLMLTYMILKWAVRDQADTISVYPQYIVWFRRDALVGEFRPTRLIPLLTFPVILNQIINRDSVVKTVMRLVSDENEKATYKLVLKD